ncbi:MAG: ribose 5-phosphate isomerase B [Candidatus Omnitrophota bacterium]|nr:MAG: ribose 5-phosphate isomerase B [Candidatus Omnitrophota bacterium]
MVKRIAIGSDHGGFKLKAFLKKYLSQKGYIVTDFGTYKGESCDYPPIGYKVAKKVSNGEFKRGILICKTGIGMAIIANKLRNVRSGVCNTVTQARTSRLHNDTNVLSLAAKYTNPAKARRIVNVWLTTEALGGRHKKRVNQIKKLEKK